MGRRAVVCRRPVSIGGRPREADPGRMPAVSRAAECRVSVCVQYGTYRGALAYADENGSRTDSAEALAARMAGDESTGRAEARLEAARSCVGGVAAQSRGGGRVAGDGDCGSGAGVHAVSL